MRELELSKKGGKARYARMTPEQRGGCVTTIPYEGGPGNWGVNPSTGRGLRTAFMQCDDKRPSVVGGGTLTDSMMTSQVIHELGHLMNLGDAGSPYTCNSPGTSINSVTSVMVQDSSSVDCHYQSTPPLTPSECDFLWLFIHQTV